MDYPRTRTPRRTLSRVGAVAGAAAVAASSVLLFSTDASAATSTVVTVKSVSPHLVSALTANQVITVTGTGFDESVISGVAVNGCTAPSYIVTGPTTLVVKTDATCTAASTGVITITDTSANTAASVPGAAGGAQALTFVTAPSLATPGAAARAVYNDNTAGMTYAQQTAVGTTASTKGGTVIRVVSGANPFATTTALPLSATLNGVAITNVKIGGGAAAGNYFTGTLGASSANAAPVLKITNNGVSKSFNWGAGGGAAVAGTFDYVIAGSTITVSPTSGPSAGGTVLTIAGTGFSTTAANDVVTVGGVVCGISGTPTATSLKCTVPATALVANEGPVNVKIVVTGGLTSVVSAGSTFTYLAQ